MAQQIKTDLQKGNQHYDVTEENRKSQNNPILLQQLLNNGISLHKQNYLMSLPDDIAIQEKQEVANICKQIKSSLTHISTDIFVIHISAVVV